MPMPSHTISSDTRRTPTHIDTHSMSSHKDEETARLEKELKKQKKKEKKRKREAEQQQKDEHEHQSDAGADAGFAATVAADDELGAKKRHKKEKKEKRRQREAEMTDSSAASDSAPAQVASSAATTAADDESARAARKAAKHAAEVRARERHDEVMAAGARALEEERVEMAEEAASAAAAAATASAAAAKSSSRKDESADDKMQIDDHETEKQRRKREKKEKKEKKRQAAATAQGSADASSSSAHASSSSSQATQASSSSTSSSSASSDSPRKYPAPPPGNVTLLLFYQYVRPNWSPAQRQHAENFTRDSLTRHGCTGRLRCAREGFNGTLTGPPDGIRAFCEDLRQYQPGHFGQTDFKLVDGLRENQRLKGLKVWHVEELVTYGFNASKGEAKIEDGGTHLPPAEWHKKAAEDGAVLIDVRNANENAIGRFQPLNDASRVLDPNMRTSTEFPEWVSENLDKLKAAKQVMMYCTGGIRCERASALLVQKGLPPTKVFQLQGGIHRYLEAFPDGGHWIGKNYTFDRRFAHGATTKEPEVVGRCASCAAPWDRYQAHAKCKLCRMEVLVCKECEKTKKHKTVILKCHLCGGPKPSYLPPEATTLKFKTKSSKMKAAHKTESDY